MSASATHGGHNNLSSYPPDNSSAAAGGGGAGSTVSLGQGNPQNPMRNFGWHGYMSCVMLVFFVIRSRVFKISLDHAKKFYRSANAIFRTVGRVANEDVVL